jgi:hypothetical protein
MPKVEALALTACFESDEACLESGEGSAAGITIGFAAASSFHSGGAGNSSELLAFVSGPVPKAYFPAADVTLADMKSPFFSR